MTKRFLERVLVVLAAASLAACAVIDASAPARPDTQARWVLLPFANHTETPLAAGRAESITESLLRAKGVADLTRYPSSLAAESLFDAGERKAQEQALEWARGEQARYAVTGAVDEWRYKVGVDGEPAVGVAVQIVDVASGKVVWSGVGAKSGWSREALAAVAQKLIRNLVDQALSAR